MTDDLDREPGMYEADGATMALVEQQRAGIIDALRHARAASVTLSDADGVRHWAMCIDADHNPAAFLLTAVVKAVDDAAELMGVEPHYVCTLALKAFEALGDRDDA